MIITAHAAGTGDGVAYLVMELVDGTSLDRLLAEHDTPVPWRKAVTWFAGVAHWPEHHLHDGQRKTEGR